MMRKITHIVMHCTATPATLDVGVDEIRQWHKNKGWSDIGYHYVVRRNGEVEVGRPLEKIGAHVSGFNKNSIGIALVGGVASDRTTPQHNFYEEQFVSAAQLVKTLMAEYDVPIVNIMGHKEVIAQITHSSPKDCPVFDMNHFRARFRFVDPVEPVEPEPTEPELKDGIIDSTWPGGE